MAVTAPDAKQIFKDQQKFETSGRSVTLAESIQHTIVVNGKYQDLMDMKLSVGSRVPSWIDQPTVESGDLYVLNFTITKNEDAEMATLNLTAVEAKDVHKPFHQTVDIDVAEVQKKIINHPLFKDDKTKLQIRLFEATEENLRYSKNGEPQCMFNLKTGQALQFPTALDDENAILYAKALLLGAETYNVYLPVVTRVSQYLKLPSVEVKAGVNTVSGVIDPEGLAKLGEFDDTVPVEIDGFTKGKWFKGGDKFQQNANGSWTRTESWTYTNDLRLEWIYKNGAAKELLVADGQSKK